MTTKFQMVKNCREQLLTSSSTENVCHNQRFLPFLGNRVRQYSKLLIATFLIENDHKNCRANGKVFNIPIILKIMTQSLSCHFCAAFLLTILWNNRDKCRWEPRTSILQSIIKKVKSIKLNCLSSSKWFLEWKNIC